MLKRALLIYIVFFVFSSVNAIDVLYEDFETNSIPPEWSQTYESGQVNWQVHNGGYNLHPPAAQQGDHNAWFYDNSAQGFRTKYISPEFAITSHAKLTFWYCQDSWATSQDFLRIFYRTSPGEEWILLHSLLDEAEEWTQCILDLPSPSDSYSIAFEGESYWGYGVCVDNVMVQDRQINILVCDIDNGSFYYEPNTREYHDFEFSITQSLEALTLDYDLRSYIPSTVSGYDIIMIELGLYSFVEQNDPPGIIDESQQDILINFMNQGGSLYIEGANVAQDHHDTQFFNYFGADYIGSNYPDTYLHGEEETFAINSAYGLPYFNSNYHIDILTNTQGIIYLSSQNNRGRAVYHETGLWRTIISAPILGTFEQSEMFSTRKFLMMEYISFLADIESSEMILSIEELEFVTYSPGAAVSDNFYLTNEGVFDLEIWDIIQGGDNSFQLETASSQIIEPYVESEITVSFRADQIGDFAGTLTFISNDLDHENAVIYLNAQCVCAPDVEVNFDSLEIAILPDEQEIRSLLVYNRGSDDLEFEFLIDQAIDWLTIDPLTNIILPLQQLQVELHFDSSGLEIGQYFTEVNLISNDPDEESLALDVYLNVQSVNNQTQNIQVIPTVCVYPNPFNPATTISFSIPEDCDVRLAIYNIKGQMVKKLRSGIMEQGDHSVIWNGNDENGKRASSGIYFYQLAINGKIDAVNKCLLLK